MQFEITSINASSEQIRTTYLRAIERARQGLRMESIGGDKTPAAITAYTEAVALCDDVLESLRYSENPERDEEAMKVKSLRDSYKSLVDGLSWLEEIQPGYVAPPPSTFLKSRSPETEKLALEEQPQPPSESQSPQSPRFPHFDVEKALSA